GEALERRARKFGVDVLGDPPTRSISGERQRAPDYELQRRVIEAERARREGMLWLFALLSAIASILSAVEAWFAVATSKSG
ncbi:MAG TPA: hypothetical protein VJY33_08980, partial [Isosphaeraceae bacterium]|nr:hypothetical protein [Isosphaeraceae bacterium]